MLTWTFQTITISQMVRNSRLLDLVERKEFERKTIDGNEGFVLKIPFLEHAFGTKYFIVDKQMAT